MIGLTGGKTVEERVGILEANVTDIRGDVRGIQHDVREMRNDLTRRPSWAVSSVITFLSSACVGLLVYAVNVS